MARNVREVGLGAECRAMRSLLEEAVGWQSGAFDDGDWDTSGADLVGWFAEWRLRVQATLHLVVPQGWDRVEG